MSSGESNFNMGKEDEDLIRRFAAMHTIDSQIAPIITIPHQAAVSRQWEMCLLARVCTDRLVFDSQFEQLMRKLWNIKPQAAFTQVDRGVYLVELTNKNEVEVILNNGPWYYRQDLVVIARCLSPSQLTRQHAKERELWVQLHNAPIEALTEEGLSMLTEPIGVALSDPLTVRTNGKKFVRIKMQIQVDEPLKDRVKLNHPTLGAVTVYVVYERVARVCLFCGCLGHELTGCKDRIRLVKIKKELEGKNRPEMQHILKPTRGPWIVNQMLLPTQGVDHDSTSVLGRQKAHTATGQKRNLDCTMVGVNQWPSAADQSVHREIGERSEVLLAETEEEMAINLNKKAKAARPHLPLDI